MSVAPRVLAVAAALAAIVHADAGTPPATSAPVHACARIEGLLQPLDVAARFHSAPPSERRGRLIAVLRQDLAEKGRAVAERLREGGATEVRVLWAAGVLCAWAPQDLWRDVELVPGAAEVFEDPPQPEAKLSDAGSAPNRDVPPEAPLVALHVPEAWDRGFTGRDVLVALIDTGVDMTHPDLAAQIWTNPGEIPGNGIDDDGNGYVDDVHGYDFADRDPDPSDTAGHGTNSAGLLAGNGASGKQTGVAPGATIMVLRRGLTEAAVWEASQYAIENGADVISQSTSWGWDFVPKPDYAGWRRQSDAELAAGILHVNSAGNNGTNLDVDPIPYNVTTPGNCPPPWLPPDQTLRGGVSSVIAAGNVDARSLGIATTSPYGPSEWTDIRARRDATYPYTMPVAYQDYPNWGGQPGLLKPDFVAQGDNSTSTAKGGGYTTCGGTSASAPRIAGVVALLRQAVPTATPADLYRALVVTARDLGPAGRDDRYGAGLPDANAAIDALGPTLFVASSQVQDPGPPQGDGDGGADAGEIVRLALTIKNTSAQTLNDVDLLLSAVSNAVVRDGYARLSQVPANGTATTSAPHFGVEFPAGSCGLTAELRLEIHQGGSVRVEPLFVAVGTETRTTLQATDFETDPGFSVSGTATSGAWVRAVPVGTTKNGQPANPSADHTPGAAQMCYVTGNGSTNPDAADVDGGRTTITSPSRDATGYQRLELTYFRWFFGSDPAGEDRFLVEAAGDGVTWKTIDEVTATENLWRERRIVLSDLITPGVATRVRFSVEDVVADDTVEGGLDDYSLVGVAMACNPWAIPATTPSPVGATLHLAPSPGGHLQLSWAPPSAGGGTDPPLGYSVRRSARPDAGFAEVGRPATTAWVEVNGMTAGAAPLQCYLVDSLVPSP